MVEYAKKEQEINGSSSEGAETKTGDAVLPKVGEVFKNSKDWQKYYCLMNKQTFATDRNLFAVKLILGSAPDILEKSAESGAAAVLMDNLQLNGIDGDDRLARDTLYNGLDLTSDYKDYLRDSAILVAKRITADKTLMSYAENWETIGKKEKFAAGKLLLEHAAKTYHTTVPKLEIKDLGKLQEGEYVSTTETVRIDQKTVVGNTKSFDAFFVAVMHEFEHHNQAKLVEKLQNRTPIDAKTRQQALIFKENNNDDMYVTASENETVYNAQPVEKAAQYTEIMTSLACEGLRMGKDEPKPVLPNVLGLPLKK